ncbi:MAG: ribonuclease P protein component [Anaerolineales bacterium]
MDRKFRLTRPSDFKRVRRDGRSYAHPLVILVAAQRYQEISRWGVTTSRSLRRATDRNRAKRRLRHALQPHVGTAAPGWDLVFIARPAILSAPWEQLQHAVEQLLERAMDAAQKERT